VGLEKPETVLSASASGRGGRKGGSVFALPPAEPVNEIGSDFFKYTPPIRKRGCWLTFCKDSPVTSFLILIGVYFKKSESADGIKQDFV